MDFKKSKGMVLGKFLPPHKGHQYLIDFAKNFVGELTVVVGTLSNEPISGELRFEWIKEMCPKVNVVHLTDENPQDPSEHTDFWNIWRESINRVLPYKPDYVFASEHYGYRLAEELGAVFIPVNKNRDIIEISGTKIRDNPFKYWDQIPDVVKPYFIKKVCILNSESGDKSILIRNLAEHYKTNFVQDYSRMYIQEKNGIMNKDDISLINQAQKASEKSLLKNANKVIFCERQLFINNENSIDEILNKNNYDLYVLTDKNDKFISELEKRNLPYIQLLDLSSEYFKKACNEIDKLLIGIK